MTNGEKIKGLLKPREDQIRIYGDWVEIEIQSLAINFSCGLDWWNGEYKEPTIKNDLAHNLCDSCKNIGCVFQSGIVRTECAFYMPPQLEPDNCGNYVVQDSITKNDSPKYCDRNICLKNEYNNVGCEDCEVTKSQEPTIQERQAESDKFDAAYQDGYNCGYAQARFDYEQDSTTKNDLAVSSELEKTRKNSKKILASQIV